VSDSQSWYARRFAQMRGEQAPPLQARSPQQYNYPQQYPQQPPQQPQYPVQGYPQQQAPGWPQQQQAPLQQPPVTIENLWGAMHQWRGGPAHKIDREPCPQCGSNQYFSRAVSKHGPPPAPHCYNCGYNDGLFTQGEPTTWGMTG
jgi:hypothetical protein